MHGTMNIKLDNLVENTNYLAFFSGKNKYCSRDAVRSRNMQVGVLQQRSRWNFERRLYAFRFMWGRIKYSIFSVGRSLIMPSGVMIVSNCTTCQEQGPYCTVIET